MSRPVISRRAMRSGPYYLGEILRRRGDLEHAQLELERVVKLTPNDQAARIHLGRAFLDDGQIDRAATEFTRALETGPSYSAEFGLGRVALKEKIIPAPCSILNVLCFWNRALQSCTTSCLWPTGARDNQRSPRHTCSGAALTTSRRPIR